MRGMSQVPGEAAVGVRVTLLAGLDHPVEPDMRIRMVDLLDVMSPMAIRAPSRLQIAQGVSFSMDRVGVGVREVLMTRSALVRDLRHELVLLDLLDLVSGVAIFTVRQFFCGIGG